MVLIGSGAWAVEKDFRGIGTGEALRHRDVRRRRVVTIYDGRLRTKKTSGKCCTTIAVLFVSGFRGDCGRRERGVPAQWGYIRDVLGPGKGINRRPRVVSTCEVTPAGDGAERG